MSRNISLDARKIIKYINDSAQSNITVIKESLNELGGKVNKKYNLVALHTNNLLFEDEQGKYYLADYEKVRGNRVNFSNITSINIKESKKSHVFNNACVDLVESISREDSKNSEIAFKKLESCKFRSTVTSTDGYAVTKDGIRRKFFNESKLTRDSIKAITEAVSAIMTGNVIIEDNQVIRASVGNIDIKLPINETIRRCNVAKQMRIIAEGAWESPKFQKLVNKVASYVSNGKVNDAISESSRFLREYQEFTLLNLKDMETLVENTLAIANQYNPNLVENVALLLYKTNLKTNKKEILETWEKTARVASNSSMLDEVYTLAESKNFYTDYQGFLNTILEESGGMSNEELEKFMLLIVKVLRDSIDEIEKDEEIKEIDNDTVDAIEQAVSESVVKEEMADIISKQRGALEEIEELINGVRANDPAAIEGAMNVINAIDADQIAASQTLQSFDEEEEIESPETDDLLGAVEEGAEEGAEEGGDLSGLDLGGEDEFGLEGLDLGGEGEGEEGEGLDLGVEGEEGEDEDEGDLDLNLPEGKDIYDDFVIAEDEMTIDDSFGVSEEEISESISDVVSDIKGMFDSEGPAAKGEMEEGEGMVSEEEDEEDEEESVEEGKKVDKEVLSGDEGAKKNEGAPKDTMEKDKGGDPVEDKKMDKDNSATKNGNNASDDDLEQIGGDNPIKS